MTSLQTEPMSGPNPEPAAKAVDRIDWLSSVPFFFAHAVPLGALFVTVSWTDWLLCGVLYAVRMFCITAGYHRYFSHRSYKMNRFFQFLMAFGGTTAMQKGPLWWASHHRVHHRYTDLDDDVHSPRDGFWWSHVGWILSTKYKAADESNIRDFSVFPELRFLERTSWIGPWLLGIACFLIGGWGGLFIGFFLSTVLLWHGTFLVNSMAHIVGRRRYATPDTSRNSLIVALVTGGEGWHNNHHYLPASVRQGFRWWEIDPTWYVLRGLASLRVVHDLKNPPARLLDQARVRDGAFDIGMFRSYWERAARLTGEKIADLTVRPLPSAEPPDPPPSATATRDDAGLPDDGEDGAPSQVAGNDHATRLSGLIARALESADQLAKSTRRPKNRDKLLSDAGGVTEPSPEG
ncbi:MAG TPA: acyl-CoA desaturase [Acidimicrobiales bacterium]|jgi:stearoyl-CoA desaturase (delta-9 desaturase)|nr:acyl-CoA desaturase [Acidimicrobiales bacterium]